MNAYKKAVRVAQINRTKYTKLSVFLANRAIRKMYKIVMTLEKQGRVSELFPLLEDPDCRVWLSHQLVERATIPKDIEDRCFRIVEGYAAEDGINGMGEKVWLEEWSAQKNRE